MVYRVLLQKGVAYEATVEVNADNEAEAKDAAETLADDDLVAWTQVFEQKSAAATEL